VNIPMLNLAQGRLYVLRCDPVPEGGGYMVATCFDELATESEDFIRDTSDGQKSSDGSKGG